MQAYPFPVHIFSVATKREAQFKKPYSFKWLKYLSLQQKKQQPEYLSKQDLYQLLGR